MLNETQTFCDTVHDLHHTHARTHTVSLCLFKRSIFALRTSAPSFIDNDQFCLELFCWWRETGKQSLEPLQIQNTKLCTLCTVDNSSSFLATDSRQLAEGHSPALARRHGTVFLNTSKTNRLSWTRLSVRSKVFCLLCTDSASSALEINLLMTARYVTVYLIIVINNNIYSTQCN